MAESTPIPPISKKRERPFLGYAVSKDRKIRYTSATQVLLSDDRHEGCMRKYANAYVFGRKLARTDVQVEGASLAECMEHYLTTAEMVLPPVLQPALKFLPSPRNPVTGEFDLLCEEPLGDIAKAVALRDSVLGQADWPRSAVRMVEAEIERLAGLTARGIPFDGAADWVHRRGTYKDKSGNLLPEPSGLVVVGIGDLKSTSQINTHVTPRSTRQGWAQTDAEVTCDPQMVSYAKHRLRLYPDATHARLEKVYAQKKSYAADIRGGLVSRQQVDDRWGELEERVVDEMIQVATAEKIADVRPAFGSCDAFTHVEPCGSPGCGLGCLPGSVLVTSGSQPCPSCKGKGRIAKGCGYRGTDDCPISTSTQVPLINLGLHVRGPEGAGMSLFDRIPVSTTSVPPAPRPSNGDYEAEVARERAALEVDGQTTMPLPSTIGEKISVTLCAVGEQYMVDCEDGHPPYRMKLREVSAGVFKFVDAMGAKADLSVKDSVWRLALGVQATPTPPAPRLACGAPGCGVNCVPGWVRSEGSGFVECKACGGKGAVLASSMAVKPPDAPKTPWIEQAAPLSDAAIAEIADPKLRELAVEHRRQCEERDRAAAQADPTKTTRGGNCPGSNQEVLFANQPTVVDGKVACPLCGVEKTIPKDVRKARPMPSGMSFPGHRRPKAEAVATPVPPTSPAQAVPVPPTPPTPPVPPTVPTNGAVPVSPSSPAPGSATALVNELFGPSVTSSTRLTPTQATTSIKETAVPVPPMPPAQIAMKFETPGVVVLTAAEVDALAAIFRDRAQAMRPMLGDKTVEMLRRLRMVD